DVISGGFGFGQRVVDEGGHLVASGHQKLSSAPPGLHPELAMVAASTTGRHGSKFQLSLPGCTTSAHSQWQRNCSRIPGVFASGANASTSAQASSASGPAEPSCLAVARPDAVGYTRRVGSWFHWEHPT